MNLLKLMFRLATPVFALGAGLILVRAGRAQPASQIGGERYLFIFNTSADMKRRLPAVRTEVNQLLATSLGGHLHPGDSVGVWTFNQDLRTGEFPLQLWKPEDAANIASQINRFIGRQRYAHQTRFSALQPQLSQVIKNSGRLTVLVFCDGEGEFTGTPYDADINRVFQQRQAAQKKVRQPFVLVFRTQLGQYIGCTMNFPPGMVNIPEFPPLPAPPAPAKTSPPVPKPAPVVKVPPAQPPPTGPPLILIGTNMETQWPPAPVPATPTNVVAATPTNPAAPAKAVAPPPTANAAPAVQTNAISTARGVSRASTNVAALKALVAPAAPKQRNPAPVTQSNVAPPSRANLAPVTPAERHLSSVSNSAAAGNAAASSPAAASPARKAALAVGVALLVAAGALAALAFFRRRPDHGSLITRSMRKD